MRGPAGAPLFLRAAAALSRADGGAAAEADRGLTGSRVAAAAATAWGTLAAGTARALGPAMGPLTGIPLAAILATAAAVPVLRLVGAPTAVVLAAAGAAGALALLRLARALHGRARGRAAAGLLLAGLVLRLALAAVVASRGGFPDERGYYHPLAEETAAAWTAGEPSRMLDYPVTSGREVYYGLLAGTYALLGADPWAGRLLGIGLGLLAALVAGELARRLGGPSAAVAGVGLLALHPEHALWSATLSRDALTTLLALAALAAASGPPGRSVPVRLAVAAAPAALLWWNSFLVAGAVTAVLVVIAGSAALVRARNRGPAGLAAVGVALLLGLAAATWVGRQWGPWFSLEMISAVRNRGLDAAALSERALGFTSFLPGLVFGHPLELAAYLPLGAAWVLAAPLPPEATSMLRLGYSLLAAGGVAISVAGVGGLARAARRGATGAAALIAFGCVYLALLAALEASSGVVVRHRLPLTAVLVAGAAPLVAGLAAPGREP